MYNKMANNNNMCETQFTVHLSMLVMGECELQQLLLFELVITIFHIMCKFSTFTLHCGQCLVMCHGVAKTMQHATW